jgi:haloalkane dehalogenase
VSGRASRPLDFPVDPDAYPFRSRWLENDEGRLHYLDEGEGRPALLLHGNPTWSFLYREIIRELRGELRLVAPDYPGFGRSPAPPGYGHTPREHAARVAALVDRLELEGLVLVAQDWGGPIGLAVATERPDRVAGLVVANSWCWPPDVMLRAFSWIMGGPVGRWLCLRHNAFARFVVPVGIHRAERRPPGVLDAYRRPFPTPESRVPTWVFPRSIRTAAPWVSAVRDRLPRLRGVPVELVWGTKDPALGREAVLRRWIEAFPDAGVDRVGDAAHYLQEDRPERLVAGIRRVVERI